jgi:hypothetical protein
LLDDFARETQVPEVQYIQSIVTKDTKSNKTVESSMSPSIFHQPTETQTKFCAAGSDIVQKSIPMDPGSSGSGEDMSQSLLSNLSRQIKSPAPTNEVLRLEGTDTFMSQSLQRLSSHEDSCQNYRPVTQVRTLRNSERGYWRIDASSWSIKDQVDFWNFLSDWLRRGRAGIATEYIRCEEDNEGYDLHAGLGIVRIYCWGELVMHIWLLSYLGCNMAMKKNGGVWISAVDGETLIVMP